jgi:hypothetical protein
MIPALPPLPAPLLAALWIDLDARLAAAYGQVWADLAPLYPSLDAVAQGRLVTHVHRAAMAQGVVTLFHARCACARCKAQRRVLAWREGVFRARPSIPR